MTSARAALPAIVVLVAAAPWLGRLLPLPDPQFAIVAALLIASATAFAMSDAIGRAHLPTADEFTRSALSVAMAAAVLTGFAAGTHGWPTPTPLTWALAALSWMLLGIVIRATRDVPAVPLTGAFSTPLGLMVYGAGRIGVAWRDGHGAVHSQTVCGPWLAAGITLVRGAVVSPLLARTRPRWFNLRRLHGAEHQVMLAATTGQPLDSLTLSGISPITARCGGTLLAMWLPLLAVAAWLAPKGLAGWASMLWAIAAGDVIRNTAIISPSWSWLLTPGLQLQRLTTTEPTAVELIAARAAVLAATGPIP